MRVSTTLAVLAWCCSWAYPQEPRSRVSSRPLPEKFLHWPFSPGEDWLVTNSYTGPGGHGNNIPYALDFQRAEGRAATSRSTVRAAAPGKVIAVDAVGRGGYGKYVVVDHGNGFATLYGHLSEVSVSAGKEIPALDKLGVAGNTGNSSGAHLHFEVRDIQGARRWQDGKFVKPEPIMGQQGFAGATTGRPLPRTSDGKTGSYSYTLNDLDPSVRNVAADVAEQLKKAFGTEQPRRASRSGVASRPPPAPPQPTPPRPSPGVSQPSRDGRRVEPPQPTPPRDRPTDPFANLSGTSASAVRGEITTFGPFQFTVPEGWKVDQQSAGGIAGVVITERGAGSAFLTLIRHPGMGPTVAYTADAVVRSMKAELVRNPLANGGRKGIVTYRPGVRIGQTTVGKDALPATWAEENGSYVLAFDYGGSVYFSGIHGGANPMKTAATVFRSLQLQERK